MSNNVWMQRGSSFIPGTTAQNSKNLPPGLFKYDVTPSGWFLTQSGDRFEFPYKIYGNHDPIVNRATTAWQSLEGNLGILLNGIKGTGKTVTAQLLCNWAIDNNIPVLMVSNPVPLSDILERIEQPIVVVFDEFEKTHQRPEHQQDLLTALDGMARSTYKRMFIFTTNTKTVNENFLDRPSRIRYCWEFKRLSDDVVEVLLDDLLKPELAPLRADIVSYLSTRQVLSIDVAKTVIHEVNTFKEPPATFADVMNLSEQEVVGFTLDVLNENGEVVRTLAQYFNPRRDLSRQLRALLTRSGRDAYIATSLTFGETHTYYDRNRALAIELVEPTSSPEEWVCHLQLPIDDTWVSKYPKAKNYVDVSGLWLDERPDHWTTPSWVLTKERGDDLTDAEVEAYEDWEGQRTVYGGAVKQRLTLRITANFESFMVMKFGKDSF